MKILVIAIILFFTLNGTSLFAQGSATGCLVSSNQIVYTQKVDIALLNSILALLFGSNPVYSSTQQTPLSSQCGTWNPTVTGTNCRVCPGDNYTYTLGLISGCNVSYLPGYEGTFTMVDCNLDDHSWLFGAAAGLFGIFIIRKRNKT